MSACLRILLAISLLLISVSTGVSQEREPISFGESFPEISLPAPATPAGRDYLGLGSEGFFLPSQIDAELLIVEVLNVHCAHCQMQAPAYSELFKLIEADLRLQGRVKMFGVALGNLAEEVKEFRSAYSVPFPVVADPQFTIYRKLGISVTPFTIFVRQDRPGRAGVVADTRKGLHTDYRDMFRDVRDLLNADLAELRRQGQAAERQRRLIRSVLPEPQLQKKIRETLIQFGGMIKSFATVPLRSGHRVYVAELQRDEERVRLFAAVVGRPSVCDTCHDVHFIYLFDRNGRVIGFEPLQLTKYGNVHWSEQDVAKMRARLIGQSLAAPRPFDPKLDAVSSATISSAIIFDSIAQGQRLLDELREHGVL